MARYIKANIKVAQYLHLENDRNTVKDGNYLLWQGDMLAFGPLTQLPETLEQIGGIALLPHEAREEQDGTVTRPLPTAKDPRFIIEAAADPEPEQPKEIEVAGEAEAETTEETDDKGTGADPENAGEAEAEPEKIEGTAEELLNDNDDKEA